MIQIAKALPASIKQELPKIFLAPKTKMLQYSLPRADDFQRVTVKSKPSSLSSPIFHDPVQRAEHIVSLMPNGQQFKAAILDVLKAEHETELAIDAKNQKFSNDLKKKYGMDLPEFNLHLAEQTQKRMAASKGRFAARDSGNETKAFDERAYEALFKPSDKEISMMRELYTYSEDCAELNAKATQKRFNFEKTLSPENLKTWKEAYLFSGPASPPNVRESAGYLVDTLLKREGLDKRDHNAMPVPDKNTLLQNAEQYLALRRDIGN